MDLLNIRLDQLEQHLFQSDQPMVVSVGTTLCDTMKIRLESLADEYVNEMTFARLEDNFMDSGFSLHFYQCGKLLHCLKGVGTKEDIRTIMNLIFE